MPLSSLFGDLWSKPPPGERRPLLLRGLDVLDPRDGSVRAAHDLLIVGERIAAIAPGGHISAEDKRVVEQPGRVAVPGLIDCHAHVCGVYLTGLPQPGDATWIPRQIAKNLRAFVRSGVTTVRDMAGPLKLERLLRRLGRRGSLEAPRLLIPGPILTTTGGYPVYVQSLPWLGRLLLGALRVDVDSPRQARRWVDHLARRGVDVVKVAYTSLDYDDARTPMPLVAPDVMRAITEQAHRHELPVAVHHIWACDLPGLLELPFDTLEHLSIEAEVGDAEVERIAARELPVTTTLMTYGIIDYLDELVELVARDEGQRYERRPARMLAELLGEMQRGTFDIPFIGRKVIETGMTYMLRNLASLREAGVLLGAGTDSGGAITPCGKMIWELRAMQRAGFTPLEALRAATSDAARVIGQPELGLLAPGRPADVVVCDGNPAESLDALERIELVLCNGRLIDPRQ